MVARKQPDLPNVGLLYTQDHGIAVVVQDENGEPCLVAVTTIGAVPVHERENITWGKFPKR